MESKPPSKEVPLAARYLRRSTQDTLNAVDQCLEKDILEGTDLAKPASQYTEKEDINFISRAILRKIDIVRDRQKKLKIIKTVAKLKSPWVPLVLLEILSDPSEEVRDFVVKELARREDLPVENFFHKLFKTPWYIKSAVLRILGLRKNQEAIKYIKLVVEDSNVDVRRSAAQALGEIGGKEAKTCLIRLTRDKNRYVKLAAEEALRKIVDLKFT